MMWAAFQGSTQLEADYLRGDPDAPRGGVTANRILECLNEHLPPLVEGEGKVFMQDGTRVHTADVVQKWLKEKGYTVMDWPPYSPDLNLIENLWFPLKHGIFPLTETIMGLRGEENQKRLLAGEAAAVWNRIPAAKFAKGVTSMQSVVRPSSGLVEVTPSIKL
jgi:transposase